jgi:hypothetical protein
LRHFVKKGIYHFSPATGIRDVKEEREFFNFLCFLFNKIREQKGRTGYAWKGAGVAQTMNTHVSKCKNDKEKRKKR